MVQSEDEEDDGSSHNVAVIILATLLGLVLAAIGVWLLFKKKIKACLGKGKKEERESKYKTSQGDEEAEDTARKQTEMRLKMDTENKGVEVDEFKNGDLDIAQDEFRSAAKIKGSYLEAGKEIDEEDDKSQTRQAQISRISRSIKIPKEEIEDPVDSERVMIKKDESEEDSSQSSACDICEDDGENTVREKIDMRGVFKVNSTLVTYSVMSSTKGYTFSIDVKTDTNIDKLFKKENFAKHFEHSSHGKLKKMKKSTKITTRKILKVMHDVFREDIETLCLVFIEEGKNQNEWIPPLKEAIAEKFCKK